MKNFTLLYVLCLSQLSLAQGFVHQPACRRNDGFISSSVDVKTRQLAPVSFRLHSTASPAAVDGTAPVLKSLLKKPSKVLTVGVEYSASQQQLTDKNALSILSMQLRKCKVSSIWCDNVEHVGIFADEQATAQGNFPGPVPVIYHGPLDQAVAAVQAGASAVVASWDEKNDLDNVDSEIIWKVSSAEQVATVLKEMGDSAAAAADKAFLIQVDNDDSTTITQGILETIPKSNLAIVALQPMQADGAEVGMARQLQKLGYASVVVQDACVGDSEDIEYAQFLVNGMTSKASSEFKFSGLTGSTNGHFGGVQANNQIKWRRVTESSS
jgi:hypothetical protein